MLTILEIERHAPTECIGNNETRKAALKLLDTMPELLKKHGIKMVGSWTVHSEHLTFRVFEAPGFEAILKFQDEPECESWRQFTTSELKVAMTMDEVAKHIRQLG